jgi:transposase
MTHDYLRNGVTTLFATFDVLEGIVLGRCMQRHRHQEFLRFLSTIDGAVPAGKMIHVILDNYGSHRHPKVLRWLARHPRFVFHFTPTAGSWLNAVETFYSALTRRRLKRGSFHSIVDLQAAIHRYIAEHNDDPKPFTWTKTPRQILAKLNPLNAPVVSVCISTFDHTGFPLLTSIEPGNQTPRAAAVGIVLATELRAQQRLFRAYAREERGKRSAVSSTPTLERKTRAHPSELTSSPR